MAVAAQATSAPATATGALATATAAPMVAAARPTAAATPVDQRVAPTATIAPFPEQREEDQFFAAIAGLTPEVTPLQDFYIVDEAVDDPRVNIRQWQLTVRGHVDRPLTLSYDQVRSLPAIDQYTTLMCISYEPGDNLISNAKWRGVRLADVLKQAGVKQGATEVVLRSVDNFDESFPIAKAQEPTTVLAYAMDEMSLPIEHGAPLRALVPGHYGYKHVKWLTDIEVVTSQHQGYWERKADWSQTGVLASAMSRIDVVDALPLKVGQPAAIGGIAFASLRGISRVEVSADGGITWLPARVKRALSPLTWRLWGVEWTPTKPGKTTLLVRTYEADGRPQVQERYPAHPSGSTGLHSIEVDVAP
jgi:DMSO/TMAO reductase YedYZ molybdopterin-dependent catalytic subunit